MPTLRRDRRFWALVSIVVVLAAIWQVGIAASGRVPAPGAVDFVPLGLFLVPVLYAALNLGLNGGVIVAAVAAVVTLPWAGVTLSDNDPVGAWFDTVQVAVLLVVAYFVGRGVTAEREARVAADVARQAHLAAEIRYHELFETNSEPILLVDLEGIVHEANAAAADLFAPVPGPMAGTTLGTLVGPTLAKALAEGEQATEAVAISEPGAGPPLLYLPVVTPTMTIDGRAIRQVVLRDMTEEARRRQRVEAYASHVLQGQEEERRRISQELHDGPLQTLIHLCRQIDAVNEDDQTDRSVSRASNGGVALDDVRVLAEAVVDEIRGISRGLRPPLLDDLGLQAALQRLCIEAGRPSGVAVDLAVEGEVPALTQAVELSVYRVAQESLSNALRHAAASHVTVDLVFGETGFRLRVVDDGAGFDAAAWRSGVPTDSSGLTGMAERAELIGGTLEVSSQPGIGTEIRMEVPVTVSRVPAVGPEVVPPMAEGGDSHC